MIYKVLKAIIHRGGYNKDEMTVKLGVFWASSQLSKVQFDELTALNA